MYAAEGGHASVVEMLLDKRAEVDARDVVRGPRDLKGRGGETSEGPILLICHFSHWLAESLWAG